MFSNSMRKFSFILFTSLGLIITLSLGLVFGLASFKANAITDFKGLDDKGNTWHLVEMADGIQITRTLPSGNMLIYTAKDFTCGEGTDKQSHKVKTTLDMSVGNSHYTFMTVNDTESGDQLSAISLSVNKRSYHSQLSQLQGSLCEKSEVKDNEDGK